VKVLVVEDEAPTAAFLHRGLSEDGFAVDVARDATAAEEAVAVNDYDAIVLDVLLPGADGFTLCRRWRNTGLSAPILFLTACDDVSDRVRGLDLGGDDYLVKPFAFSELLARVRSISRRGPHLRAETLRVGDLEIDPFQFKASRAGTRLDLTPKEFALLTLLARHAGEVLSRTFIVEQVWDMNFDPGSNVVDVHLRRLRAKLDDPFERKLLRTVRGVGYVLDDEG
jgi:two-component system copper resistance phosphate regulon response regulator CusR